MSLRLLAVPFLALIALAPAVAPAALFQAPAAPGAEGAQGSWDAPFDGQVPAVNMVLLNNGKVLYWSGVDGHAAPTVPFLADAPAPALARVFDPATGAITVPSPEDGGAGDMFCSGQSVLPDGRVLIVGGTEYGPIPETAGFHVYGLDSARLFDPATETFTTAPDMAEWRWYPTSIGLPDGDVLVASGISDLPDLTTHVSLIERYDAATGTWSSLPPSASNLLPLYPRLFTVPSGPLKGDVFYTPNGCLWCPFGEYFDESAWNLDQSLDFGTNTWTQHRGALFGVRQHAATVMLPLRGPDYHAELLTFGGTLHRSIVATPLAERTDLSVVPPAHSATAAMANARWHLNGVLLPTGEVLAVGGGAIDSVMLYSAEDPGVLPAELYDPEAIDPVTGLKGVWTTMASMQVPRMYHSTALLLPDGRVVVGGHVPLPNIQVLLEQVNERRLEVFSPPYLFRGERPVITSAPASVAHGAAFSVGVADTSGVTGAMLVKPGSTTHSNDFDQRVIALNIEGTSKTSLQLRAPPDGAVAPPGSYMLFLLRDTPEGPTPSEARFVRIG